MNEPRDRRSAVGGTRARRGRRPRAAGRAGSGDPREWAHSIREQAALAFLTEILVGDCDWTLGEVRRLVALREAADRGRWQARGSDGAGGG